MYRQAILRLDFINVRVLDRHIFLLEYNEFQKHRKRRWTWFETFLTNIRWSSVSYIVITTGRPLKQPRVKGQSSQDDNSIHVKISPKHENHVMRTLSGNFLHEKRNLQMGIKLEGGGTYWLSNESFVRY